MVSYVYESPHEHRSTVEVPNEDRTYDDIEFIEETYYDLLYKEAVAEFKRWAKKSVIVDFNRFLKELANGKHLDFVDAVVDYYELEPVESGQWFYDNILMPTAAVVNDAERKPVDYAAYLLENSDRTRDEVIDELVYEITMVRPMNYYTNLVDRYISGKTLDDDECADIADFILNDDQYLTASIIDKAADKMFENYKKNPNRYIKDLILVIGDYRQSMKSYRVA